LNLTHELGVVGSTGL